MPALPQFDYIFAIATIFAFLDAWNIGMITPFTMFSVLQPCSRTSASSSIWHLYWTASIP
jgi:hypothetical protein